MIATRQFVDKDKDEALEIMLKSENFNKWNYSTIYGAYTINESMLRELKKNNIKMRVIIPEKNVKKKRIKRLKNSWDDIESVTSSNGIRITKYKNGTTLSQPIDKYNRTYDERQQINADVGYWAGGYGY